MKGGRVLGDFKSSSKSLCAPAWFRLAASCKDIRPEAILMESVPHL